MTLDGTALGHWVELALPEPPWSRPVPFVGYVYLDASAGLSAKGGPADEPAAAPSLTVRLPIGVPSRVMTDAEAAPRATPPAWIDSYGPQPQRDAPWRLDRAMAGRWHRSFPDDVQVLVHDGDPRGTGRLPEGCWVRVDEAKAIGARPATAADGAVIARGAVAYVGALLHPPRQLTSVVEGARVTFVPDPGGKHPLAVSDAYLAERARWTIGACPRCGLGEAFDPPSALAAARFGGAGEVIAFTAHCPMCGPPSAQSFAPA